MPVDVAFDGLEEDDDRAERVVADAERALLALDMADAELSVLLCDDDTIQPLNRDWRGIDAPTDVLSFPQDDAPNPGGLLGDVVISVQTAARQADEAGHDLHTELRVLLVHGLCHLLGHDHEEPDDAREMQALEARLLAAVEADAAGLIARSAAET